MRIQLSKAIAAVAISSTLCLGAAWGQTQPQPAQQAKPQKNWKDRAEYELFEAINKTTDPKKKLELLNQWKEKYPNTELKLERLAGYLDAYRGLNDPAKMYETAKEMIALGEDPNVQARLQAFYWLNLLVPTPSITAPDKMDIGKQAANGLLAISDQFFTAANKPPSVSDGDWQKNKSQMQALAHRTLGWIAWQQKNLDEAETQLTEDIKLNPADAEASYWLGTIILAQKKPERQSEALYHIARAAAYDGPGAMDATRRNQLQSYIEKSYSTYHGKDPQSLQQLLQQAKTSPFPPQGFHIPSEAELKEQKEKQLEATNPSLAFWMKLKSALDAPDGQQYFESGMKGAMIPPEGQPPLRGTVISQEGARAAKSVVLGISHATTPEVRLNFETPLPGRAEPGTVLDFRGVATSFTKEPFTVTFDAEKQHVSGWPAPAPPAKKAPVRRKKK